MVHHAKELGGGKFEWRELQNTYKPEDTNTTSFDIKRMFIDHNDSTIYQRLTTTDFFACATQWRVWNTGLEDASRAYTPEITIKSYDASSGTLIVNTPCPENNGLRSNPLRVHVIWKGTIAGK